LILQGLIPSINKIELKVNITGFSDEMILEEWMDRLNLNWLDDNSLNDHLDILTKAIKNKN
jgi:hypothetical protein